MGPPSPARILQADLSKQYLPLRSAPLPLIPPILTKSCHIVKGVLLHLRAFASNPYELSSRRKARRQLFSKPRRPCRGCKVLADIHACCSCELVDFCFQLRNCLRLRIWVSFKSLLCQAELEHALNAGLGALE